MSSWQEKYDRSVRDENERAERADAERTESEKFVDRISWAPDLFLLPIAAILAGITLLYRFVRRRRDGPA